MKLPSAPVSALCTLFIAVPLFAGPSKFSDGYTLIKSIKSPQELLFPHFPRKYCVPVTLSGTIAAEMKGALDSLKLEPPVYRERFDGRTFGLFLMNGSYTAQTRELLGGILNPVELIDIVVESIIRYREGEKYAEIIRDTRLQQDTAVYNGRPVFVICLVPKGERFAYTYQDMGAFVHESWLTKLTLTIDTATRVVNELSTIRYSRTYDATAAERPAAGITNARYQFAYETKEGILLPARLTLFFNTAEVLKLEAWYRQQEKFFVFDRKEICSSLDGASSCLSVGYGEYRFSACDTAGQPILGRNKNYAKRLERAAELSKTASEKLRIGQIAESVRVLQKLVEQYGDTPQAVEARRLLSQLPKELQ